MDIPALDQYDYTLPDELIAREPAHPRDSARLFVYETARDTIHFDTFRNLPNYLPRESLLVFNDTKVLPARLVLEKETGGKVVVLLAMNELREGDTEVKGVSDRRLTPGQKLLCTDGNHLLVTRQEEQYFYFLPSVPLEKLTELLMKEGQTPIPPYIKGSTLTETELRERYQSILARAGSSIAAPTASLHFTDTVLDSLQKKGIGREMVTLHVGAGTFAPLRPENFATHALFAEYCALSHDVASRLNEARASGTRIIPVGSTALRTLESCAVQKGQLEGGEKATTIFIYPPHEFLISDGLITNFHVPRSSLMLMVDALLQHKGAQRRIMGLYQIAMEERFRFYSFGDGMLIL